MFFGRSQWTICRVGRLSLFPEFYTYGLAAELLRSAEQEISEQHALLGVGDLEDLDTTFTDQIGDAIKKLKDSVLNSTALNRF